MTWAVLPSIVLTGIWTLILVWQQESRHGERANDVYLPEKKKNPQEPEETSERQRGSIHPYWRCRTLKWWTTLWSSRHITLIAPISPFLCGEELLRCGKLPKAEWKGPFIMRKWHNTQIPLRWAWDGSFRALTNLQIIMKTSLSASFPSWMLKNHQWQI